MLLRVTVFIELHFCIHYNRDKVHNALSTLRRGLHVPANTVRLWLRFPYLFLTRVRRWCTSEAHISLRVFWESPNSFMCLHICLWLRLTFNLVITVWQKYKSVLNLCSIPLELKGELVRFLLFRADFWECGYYLCKIPFSCGMTPLMAACNKCRIQNFSCCPFAFKHQITPWQNMQPT